MGKLFFYVALALVVVSGVLFAPEHAALAIHPMDQFIVNPVVGDQVSMFAITNVTLWLALAVLCVFLLMVVGSSRRAIVPRAGTVDCRIDLRLYLQNG